MDRNHQQEGGAQEHGRRQAEGRPEQRFFFGAWVFNVDRAQDLIANRPREPQPLAVAPWARFYGLDNLAGHQPVSVIGPGPDFDPDYAMTTDLEQPIIVASLLVPATEPAPLLIDGTHRLYRAHHEHLPTVPAYVLSAEETLAIREDGEP